jgi:uncharacterized protein involved in exopolysaccharide biosynthesis
MDGSTNGDASVRLGWRTLWGALLRAVVAALVGAAVAVAIGTQLPPTYRAEASLLVGRLLSAVAPGTDQIAAAQSLTETYAELATTRPVLAIAAEAAGIDEPIADVEDRITVRTPTGGPVLVVTAVAGSADQAADLANGIAEELLARSPAAADPQVDIAAQLTADLERITADLERVSAELDEQLDDFTPDEERIAQLEDQLTTLRASRASAISLLADVGSNELTIVEPAEPPADSETPRPWAFAVAGAAIGFLLTAGVLALASGGWDRRPPAIQATRHR